MRLRRCAATLLCLLSALASPCFGQTLEERMRELVQDLDALTAAHNLTLEARSIGFLSLIEPAFDIDHMARAAMPPDALSDHDFTSAYLRAYRAHLIHSHVQALRFGPTRSTLLGMREPDGNRIVLWFLVETQNRRREVVWFTCAKQDARICEIESDGIRLSTRQSETFGPALKRMGPERFLEALNRGRLVEAG